MKTGGTGHHRRILVGTAKTAHDLKRPFWFFFFVSLAKTKKKKKNHKGKRIFFLFSWRTRIDKGQLFLCLPSIQRQCKFFFFLFLSFFTCVCALGCFPFDFLVQRLTAQTGVQIARFKMHRPYETRRRRIGPVENTKFISGYVSLLSISPRIQIL